MRYIEPHIHMVSRTTDDYQRLAESGVVAMTEPAFWAGFDRCSADGFSDYFRQLTVYEPRRAALFGIAHYCWICLNPKEAEDLALAKDVLSIVPDYLRAPSCLGVGEIGLNKNSRNELQIFEAHVQLAADLNQMILIHTPHLEDKYKGTRLIIDVLQNHSAIDPARVIIDHVEEHTAPLVLDHGFWAGMTLYPQTKCTPARAVDILETCGTDRIWLNSAADWGVSDPLAVAKFQLEARRRGHADAFVHKIVFENPVRFLGQNPKFQVPA
jgi:predicted metal-dependent TIM-barrel fold hydrolase